MPNAPEPVQMSTIIPRRLLRRFGPFLERHLSLRAWDLLNQFWVETRLIFSRAIVLLVIVLLAFFSIMTITHADSIDEKEVFQILSFQVSILAILLNMNLWEVEREGRTFELLIMRIPNLNRLIWFKLRVSILWLTALSLPFFAAYGWFLEIPFGRVLLFFLFITSFAVLVSFVTCVVTSFVHHGLTSGIITFILTAWVIAICDNMRFPYFDFFRLAQHPFELALKELSVAQTTGVLVVNRCVLILVIAGFYRWLLRRLAKTEKWIQ